MVFVWADGDTPRLTGGEKIQTGPVVAASLGLLAFMLAFTFGAVTKRYDDRKQLVLDEANAIGTACLRADLLPEPDRDSVRRLLYDYAQPVTPFASLPAITPSWVYAIPQT